MRNIIVAALAALIAWMPIPGIAATPKARVVTVENLEAIKRATRGASNLTVVVVGDFTLDAKSKVLTALGNAGPITLDLRKATIRGFPVFSQNHDLTVVGGTFVEGRVRANDPRNVTFEEFVLDRAGFVAEGGEGLTLRKFRGEGGLITIGVSTRNNPVRRTVIEDFHLSKIQNDMIKVGAPQNITIQRGTFIGETPKPGQHMDVIQLLPGTEDSVGIYIRDNKIMAPGMGINPSTKKGVTYRELYIEGNTVVTGSTLAISDGDAASGRVANNTIEALPNARGKPNFRLGGATERTGNKVNGRRVGKK